MATMVRPERGTQVARIVELRGVEPGFPFYGTLVLQGGARFTPALLAGNGALVGPDLLAQLGIAVGDRIIVGSHPFTVRGVIDKEPGRSVGGFSLGSRVLVDLADLRATGLLAFGSRATYQILLKVPAEAAMPLAQSIRESFAERFVNARSFRSTENQIGDSFDSGRELPQPRRLRDRRARRHRRVERDPRVRPPEDPQRGDPEVCRRDDRPGAGHLRAAGGAAGAGREPARRRARLGRAARDPGPPDARPRRHPLRADVVGRPAGATVGLLVSLLFALVPLLDIRTVKPLLLLRRRAHRRAAEAASGWQVDGSRWASGGGRGGAGGSRVMAGGIVAGRRRRLDRLRGRGAGPVPGGVRHRDGGLAARLRAVVSAAPCRHQPRRPGNQTRVILLSVGLGSFFVLGVRALQGNLVEEFSIAGDRNGADLFLIDIQRDQVEGVRSLLASRGRGGGAAAAGAGAAGAGHRGARARESTWRGSPTCAAAVRSRAST